MEAAVTGPKLGKRLKCTEAPQRRGWDSLGHPTPCPRPVAGCSASRPSPSARRPTLPTTPTSLPCSKPALRTPGQPLTTAQLRPPGHLSPSRPPTPSHPVPMSPLSSVETPRTPGMVRSNSRSHLGTSRRHRKRVEVRTFRPSRPPAPLAPSAPCPRPRSCLCPPLPTRPLHGGLCRPCVSGRTGRHPTLLPLWLRGTQGALVSKATLPAAVCGSPASGGFLGSPSPVDAHKGPVPGPPSQLPAPFAGSPILQPRPRSLLPGVRSPPVSTYTGADHADPMVGLSPTPEPRAPPGPVLTLPPSSSEHRDQPVPTAPPRGPGRVGPGGGHWTHHLKSPPAPTDLSGVPRRAAPQPIWSLL